MRYFLEMQITYGEEDGGIRIRQRGERKGGKNVDGKRRGGVIDARLPETSASADARAFFSLSDAKIAPRSLHGRGFCRDCSTVRRPFD